MANPEKTTKTAPVANAAASDDFDITQYLPAGADPSKIKVTGGLTPIYRPEDAYNQKWPPVIGDMKCVEKLDAITDFDSFMIRVVCVAPTKGISADEPVDVPVGSEVLVPVSGNLRSNREILAAATNGTSYYRAGFKVTGQKEMGKGRSDMWVVKAKLIDVPMPRLGTSFELPDVARPLVGTTGDGKTVFDLRTGEVLPVSQAHKLSANNAQASA
jgi:hypothetical protein